MSHTTCVLRPRDESNIASSRSATALLWERGEDQRQSEVLFNAQRKHTIQFERQERKTIVHVQLNRDDYQGSAGVPFVGAKVYICISAIAHMVDAEDLTFEANMYGDARDGYNFMVTAAYVDSQIFDAMRAEKQSDSPDGEWKASITLDYQNRHRRVR